MVRVTIKVRVRVKVTVTVRGGDLCAMNQSLKQAWHTPFQMYYFTVVHLVYAFVKFMVRVRARVSACGCDP